jgi:hypothetical protein
MTDWLHGSTQCLSGKDLTGYDLLSITQLVGFGWVGSVGFELVVLARGMQ